MTYLTIKAQILTIALILGTVSGFPQTKTYCYGPPTESCTSHTLTCPDAYVISVTSVIYGTKAAGTCPVADICTGDPNCCKYLALSERGDSLSPEIMNSIQQNCTYQQSCTLNLPYAPSPVYHFVHYSYDCIKASQILSMMCKDTVTTGTYSYMFYFGKQRQDSLKINCSCSITSESSLVTLYTRYIKLSEESCQSFGTTFSTLGYPACSGSGYEDTFRYVNNLPPPVNMPVNNLAARPDDILWLRFNSRDLKPITVDCTGCGVRVDGACGTTVKIAQGCYGGAACPSIPLSCKDGSFIGLTSSLYLGQRSYVQPTCQTSTCNTDETCCRYKAGDILNRLNNAELEKLYRDCTYRQSCEARPDYRNPGNATYGYYRYECIPESAFVSMVETSSVQGFTEGFIYYNGSTRSPNTTIDCACRVTSPGDHITVNVYYKKLHPDNCCKVNMTAKGSVIPEACTEESGVSVFSSRAEIMSVPIVVHLNQLLYRPDDFMVIKFSSGSGIDISCDGCTEQPDTDNDVCTYPKPAALKAEADSDDTIPIAMGVLGGLLLLLIILFIVWRCKRSKKTTNHADF